MFEGHKRKEDEGLRNFKISVKRSKSDVKLEFGVVQKRRRSSQNAFPSYSPTNTSPLFLSFLPSSLIKFHLASLPPSTDNSLVNLKFTDPLRFPNIFDEKCDFPATDTAQSSRSKRILWYVLFTVRSSERQKSSSRTSPPLPSSLSVQTGGKDAKARRFFFLPNHIPNPRLTAREKQKWVLFLWVMVIAALLHNISKLGIPRGLLERRGERRGWHFGWGSATEEEWIVWVGR